MFTSAFVLFSIAYTITLNEPAGGRFVITNRIVSVLLAGAVSGFGLALMMPFMSLSSGVAVGPSLLQLSLALKIILTLVKLPSLSIRLAVAPLNVLPSSKALYQFCW